MLVHERNRLSELHSYDILYSSGDERFDDLAELASRFCEVPIAQINFIDEQNQWSLTSCGMKGETVPREESFCNKTIQQEDSLIIEDARKDPRFKDNIFVTDEPHIRFYAGINIKSRNGGNLGTICVIDHKPRQMSDQQLDSLRKIARQVEHQLELRHARRQREKKDLYLNSTSDVQLQVDAFTLSVEELTEGVRNVAFDHTNGNSPRLDEVIEASDSKQYLHDWLQSAGPDSKPLQLETRLKIDGVDSIWYELTGTYKYGKCYITGKNIHKLKKYKSELERERKFTSSLVESIPGLLVQFDESGCLQHWNDRASHVVGKTDEELEGGHFTDLLSEQNYKISRSIFELQRFGSTYLELEFSRQKENQSYYFTFVRVQQKNENTYLGIGIDITRRIQSERKLKEALEDKTALLAEVHHRVKNNLAIVSGLLELEADNYNTDAVRQGFQKSQVRIQSIAKIHEKLYGSQQFRSIPLKEYLGDVLEAINESFDPNSSVNIKLECDPILLNINQAIPLALILNELVVNAFQHAFNQQKKGKVWVRLQNKQGTLITDVSDNGQGLPPDFDVNDPSSLGMSLINKLSKQLRGTLEVKKPSQSHFHVEFPIRHDQQGAHSHGNW